LKLAERILFSEKDFVHAVRKWAFVPKKTYAYFLLVLGSGDDQLI